MLIEAVQRGPLNSWKDIANLFVNRSPDAVRNKYKKLFPNSADPFERDEATAAAKYKQGDDTTTAESSDDIQKLDDRRKKLWTKEEDARLRDLVLQYRPQRKADWETIAQILGRTVKAIKHKYNDYNLEALVKDMDVIVS